MTSQFLLKFYIPLHYHERKLLCTFLAEKINTWINRSPLKWKFLRLLSSHVKICEISYIYQFWNDKSIPLQMLYALSVSWKITPLYFFSSNNIYFAQKKPIKKKIFGIFECSGQNLSNSLCQLLNKLIPLKILYPNSISWKITSLYFFRLNNIYFAQNQPTKMNIFENF